MVVGHLFSAVGGLCQVAGIVGSVAGALSTATTVTSALGTVGQVATAVDSVTGNPAFVVGTLVGGPAAEVAACCAKAKHA